MRDDDEFEWLANSGEQAEAWLSAQGHRLSDHFNTDPLYLTVHEELTQVVGRFGPICSTPKQVGDYAYWSEKERRGCAYVVYRCPLSGGDPELVLDIEDALAGIAGDFTKVTGWEVSPRAKYIAVFVSTQHDSQGIVVLDIATRRIVDTIPQRFRLRMKMWANDELGIFYDVAEPNLQAPIVRVYWHAFGTDPWQDCEATDSPYFTGIIAVEPSADGKWLIANSTIRSSCGYIAAFNVQSKELRVIAEDLGAQTGCMINGPATCLLAAEVLTLSTGEDWRCVTSQVGDVYFTSDGILVLHQTNDGDRLSLVDYDGNVLREVAVPKYCRVCEISARPDSEVFWYSVSGLLAPLTIYCCTRQAVTKVWQNTDVIGAANYVAYGHAAQGQDGTSVPLTLVRGEEYGNGPVLLLGYGGFNIPRRLDYVWWLEPLLRRGVTVAFLTLRGDGGCGIDWYKAGTGINRQNTLADVRTAVGYLREFVACGQPVVAMGFSNGGLTMAASCVLYPDLFDAVVMQAPVTDLLRGNGDWKFEYGDPDGADREAMLAWSPFQNIQRGIVYPPQLVLSNRGDRRVRSADHGWRYVAKLIAANPNNEVWLSSEQGGHSLGTKYAQALCLTFVLQQMGYKD